MKREVVLFLIVRGNRGFRPFLKRRSRDMSAAAPVGAPTAAPASTRKEPK